MRGDAVGIGTGLKNALEMTGKKRELRRDGGLREAKNGRGKAE